LPLTSPKTKASNPWTKAEARKAAKLAAFYCYTHLRKNLNLKKNSSPALNGSINKLMKQASTPFHTACRALSSVLDAPGTTHNSHVVSAGTTIRNMNQVFRK
jgi:hypothetical protein